MDKESSTMEISEDLVAIDPARLERMIEVIAVAAIGAYDDAIERLATIESDRFGAVEGSLLALLGDLAEANRRSAEALEQVAAANRELEEKIAVIERQRDDIRELSVPIIEVWDDVLTLPLVGSFDTSRAVEVTERLLHRVVETRIRWVLIDLTGVAVVDTSAAHHLLQLAKSVKLLGARCILTGLNDRLASTLVALGVSFSELTPMRTLRQGLKHCIAQRTGDRRR
jgi:rsbT co-antagonist protein RsbR